MVSGGYRDEKANWRVRFLLGLAKFALTPIIPLFSA